MKSNKWLKRLNVSMLTFLLLGTVTPTASVMAETLSDKSDDLETTEVSEEPSKTEKEEAKEVKISETKKDADRKDKKVESDEKEDVDKEKESTDNPDKKKLTILGTSDVHGNVWDWSYEDDKEADLGFAKISTLVKQERAKNKNNILVDAGDNLQGTLLTDDLYSSQPELQNEDHPVITAMNTIGYDAMALGNHEFNFGTDLIKRVEEQADFPLLSANTYLKGTDENFVKATEIIPVDGLKVAVIGMTIPHVPMWDGEKVSHLDFKPLKEEAEKQVKNLKENEKPDVIVASIHAGLDNSRKEASAREVIENVPEIDAFVLGHDHRQFAEMIPDKTGKEKPAAAVKDTGSGMVKIDLDLEKKDGKWEVTKSTPTTLSVKGVKGDEEVREATKEAHEKTLAHVNEVIGEAKENFLPEERVLGIPEAQLQPTAMISLINNVQMEATGADLGSAALFKYDSKLDKGPIKFSDVFNIYKYPNTLVKAKMNGAQLKKYLEKQGGYYQQYEEGDVTIGFNPKVRIYNYDMISGVKYKIDISQPVGSRIKDLTFKGKPVADDQEFTMAMNNYRFEGMAKDGLVDPEAISDSDPATLRGFIVDYIKEKKVIDPKEEIENNFEIIGADLDHPARDFIIEQANAGKDGFKTEVSADGRTPNVKKLNANKLYEEGLIPSEHMNVINVMHTNDMHGRMAFDAGGSSIGLGRVKTFKDNKKPTVLVDAGDAMQGLPISNYSKGMDMVKAMNAVGYDGMTLGNHEFDFGLETALKYKEKLNFPIVSANVYYKENGERPFEPYAFAEKEVNGKKEKIAMIGLTTPETSVKTHPNNVIKVDFKKPAPVAIDTIKEIKEKDANVKYFVFMTHLGLDETTIKDETSAYLAEELAKKYPKENIFIADGHSHSELPEGIKENKVLIGQTGEYLHNVGMMTGDYRKEKAELKAELHPFSELKDLTPDPEVEKIVATAKENFDKEMSQVVLKDNKITLNGERENVRSRETNLGNLVGDSLIAYGNNGGFKNHSDFAIMNGGGIRVTIKPGEVTKGDIVGVMPFGNTVSQIKVTGNEIYAMFEHSLRSIHKKDETGNVIIDENGVPALGANGGFLQVSDSIKVTYDSNLQGAEPENGVAGKRVTRIEIKDKSGKFVEVPRKDNVTYNMVTNDFLAAGGDGYEMLKGKPVEQGPSMDEVFMKYLSDEKLDLNTYAEEFPYSRIIGKESSPQGPYIKDGRYVQIVKKNYNLWSNFDWKKRNNSNNVLNEIFTATGKYNHENGETYLSLHDSKGKWQGYINEKAIKEVKNLQGDYIKYGRYVTINRTGYKTWSNFNWKKRNDSANLLNNTYEARAKYKHANGSTYLSLYDKDGKWHGYINKNAVKVGEGKQGGYISDGSYVTISKNNYNTWSNFNWKKRKATNKIMHQTYQAKGRYQHFNGEVYYSLFNNEGKWQGYINAKAVNKGSGKQGAYINHGKKVKINKKGYNTWTNFSWKKRNSTDKMMGQTFTAKVKYNHMNGATYYSLYDNDGKWHGYVNKNAVK